MKHPYIEKSTPLSLPETPTVGDNNNNNTYTQDSLRVLSIKVAVRVTRARYCIRPLFPRGTKATVRNF